MTAQNNWPSTPFNSGYAFQIDSDTHPTPTQIRVLQSSSLSTKATNKELYGQNIFAVAVGRGSIKVSGKIKFAESSPRLVRDFVGGANNSLMNAGQTLVANNEAQSVPGTSPYTITVTNAATFSLDLGVLYQATGEPLTNVASARADLHHHRQNGYAAGFHHRKGLWKFWLRSGRSFHGQRRKHAGVPDIGIFDKALEVAGVWFGVKYYSDCTAIAFRGSDNLGDWMRDFRFRMVQIPNIGGVEQGFWQGMSQTMTAIWPLIKRPFYVTGHSLGAAHGTNVSALLTKASMAPDGLVNIWDAKARRCQF